jgi:GrpB-like predicted nucleotidyltransferase (UPF0157 family)
MPQPSNAIAIVEYDPRWPALYEEERERIVAAIDEWAPDVHHVGSTAVPGLAAKPIIDIMVAMRSEHEMVLAITPLVQTGYECLGEYGIPGRIYFRKTLETPGLGQSHGGVARTHHLHMFPAGHAEWDRHIHFRDYLRAHPSVAMEYQSLKRELAARFSTDFEGYTDAKTEFIRGIEARAALALSPSHPSTEGQGRGDAVNTR